MSWSKPVSAWGRICFQIPEQGCGQDSVPGLVDWAHHLFLGCPDPVPGHVASQGQLTTRQVDTWAHNKGSGWKPPSPWNLFSEVTSHHFCSVLLARSESLGYIHSWEEEITQGYQYQEGEVIGVQLKSCWPRCQGPWKSLHESIKLIGAHVSRKQFILSHLPMSIACMIFPHPHLFPLTLGCSQWGGVGRLSPTGHEGGQWALDDQQGRGQPWLSLEYHSVSQCIFPPCLAARWSHPFGKLHFIESWLWFHFPLPAEGKDGKISDLSQLLNLSQTRFGWGLSSFSKWVSKWSRSVVSNSLWPHGLQPTRLLHPCNLPGKSTGMGCHFLLQVSQMWNFKSSPNEVSSSQEQSDPVPMWSG